MFHHLHPEEEEEEEERPAVTDDGDDDTNHKSSSLHMASTSDHHHHHHHHHHGYYFRDFTSSSSLDMSSPTSTNPSTTSRHLMAPAAAAAASTSYSQHHQFQSSSSGFHDHLIGPSEIYSLATGVEMIAFHNTNSTSGTITPPPPPKTLVRQPPTDKPVITARPPPELITTYHQDRSTSSYPMLTPPDESTWQRNIISRFDQSAPSSSSSSSSHRQRYDVHEATNRRRPTQGLSLSLNSNNNTIGLQSFTQQDERYTPDSRWRTAATDHHQQQQQEEEAAVTLAGQQFELLKGSKYLASAQELLNEFCCLGTKQLSHASGEGYGSTNDPPKQRKKNKHEAGYSLSSSSSSNLSGLDTAELQKRKKRLLFMLDELDRRYKHYCEQMKAVVSSFEAVAGEHAAAAYTALASKAMSRHFRSLRDGIVNQIKAHSKVMSGGDTSNKDICGEPSSSSAVPETTPRLRMLDQALRQEKALQQMSLMESHPWRPQRGLPERAVSVLRAWLFEHFLHPYPSDVDKHILARQTGLTRGQVSNWFINARVRLWKPMVEEMYVEETKEELQDSGSNLQAASSSHGIHNDHLPPGGGGGGHLFNTSVIPHQYNSMLQKPDHKPTQDQLLRIMEPEHESLSSIVNHNSSAHFDRSNYIRNPPRHPPNQGFTSAYGSGGGVGSMDHLDLLPYHDQNVNLVQTNFGLNGGHAPSPIDGGGGATAGGHVSLTLGLHQNSAKVGGGGGSVSLAFPQGQGSLYYTRGDHAQIHQFHGDHQEDGSQQVHQYNSMLDEPAGQQEQNLPYRNLLGAQLLHDLGS